MLRVCVPIQFRALYDMVWYGMVWCGMVWYGMAWYVVAWHGMVWYGMVWYGMVWYGMVWYGMVWYDVVWKSSLLRVRVCFHTILVSVIRIEVAGVVAVFHHIAAQVNVVTGRGRGSAIRGRVGLHIQCGVSFFILDLRRVFAKKTLFFTQRAGAKTHLKSRVCCSVF